MGWFMSTPPLLIFGFCCVIFVICGVYGWIRKTEPIAVYSAFGAVVLSGVWIFAHKYITAFNHQWPDSVRGDWGVMGDYFGGVLNPILAFASFIALLYTIVLQSKEMQKTREEARLSRIEQARAVVIAQENLQQQAAQEEFKFAMDLLVNRLHEADVLLRSESRGLSVISFVNSAKVAWGDRDGAPVSREHLNQLYKRGHVVDDSVSARFVGLCNFLARDLHLVSTVATKLKMDNGKDSLLDLYTEKVAELCFFGACVDSRGNLTADYIKRNSLLNDKFKEYHDQNGFESPEVVAA